MHSIEHICHEGLTIVKTKYPTHQGLRVFKKFFPEAKIPSIDLEGKMLHKILTNPGKTLDYPNYHICVVPEPPSLAL